MILCLNYGNSHDELTGQGKVAAKLCVGLYHMVLTPQGATVVGPY